MLESALGSAPEQTRPTMSRPPRPVVPYLPSAEPAGGQPPEPFGEIESVTEPVLAALQRAVVRRRARSGCGSAPAI